MTARKLISLLCLLLLAACNAPSYNEVALKPHIVLLLADDLGWKDVGYRGGNIKTPHIDRLAEGGVRLEQFYAQSVCSPTRAALLTGRYPIRTGLQCNVVRPWAQHGLPPEERTLGNALKDAGYRTAIVGKWHLGHNRPGYLPTQRGFDLQYGHYNGMLDYFTHIRDGALDWHKQDQVNRDEGYTTELIGREAVNTIRDHNISQKLFLYVPFNAPHSPFQAVESYLEMYEEVEDERRRTYMAMVSHMDDAIGEIMTALKEKGIRDETLVLFFSDNGGVKGIADNGHLRAGKGTVYEGGLAVPAVLNWPGKLPAGKKIQAPLHMVDIYPTLIKIAGGSLIQKLVLDGKDALPSILDNQPSPHTEILLDHSPFRGAIRVGDWKLVLNSRFGALEEEGGGEDIYELYNLAEDPGEQNNLASKETAVLEKLKQRLTFYGQEAAPPFLPGNSYPEDFEIPEVWAVFKDAGRQMEV